LGKDGFSQRPVMMFPAHQGPPGNGQGDRAGRAGVSPIAFAVGSGLVTMARQQAELDRISLDRWDGHECLFSVMGRLIPEVNTEANIEHQASNIEHRMLEL